MIVERSAGGVAIRYFDSEPYLAAIRVKGGTVLALPKGMGEAGETPEQTAAREVREETGVEVRLVEKLDDLRYWYVRDSERVRKTVSFYLFDYISGSLEDHDHEVDSAEWVSLELAPSRLHYRGERDIAKVALTRVRSAR